MKGYDNVYKSGGGKPGRIPPLPDFLVRDEDDDYDYVSEYKFSDGWVYFEHYYETSTECVNFYKMRSDGSGLENYYFDYLGELSLVVTEVKDGWVYYTINNHDDWEMDYKMRTDGSEVQEVK